MRLLTHAGSRLWLLDQVPDWTGGFRVVAALPREVEAGLSDREGRRALAEFLRLRLRYQIQAEGAEARTLAAGLRALKAEPVAAPLWPVACRWADRAAAEMTGGLNVVFPAAGGAPIVYAAGAEPGGLAADDVLVPLVLGRLEERQLTVSMPGLVVFAVELLEDGPAEFALSPRAYTAPAGPQPAAYAVAPRLFALPVTWDDPRTSLVLKLARDEVGFGRVSAPVQRGAVARLVEHTVWAEAADGAGVGALLRFFLEHAGGRAFWAAGRAEAGRLLFNVVGNAGSIGVEDGADITAGDYLALTVGGAPTQALGPVSSVAVGESGTTIFLTPNGNAAASAVAHGLAPLLLARFDAPEIELQWQSPGIALATFRARELPAETVPPAGETLGLYIGALARRAWLYEFTRDLGGAVVAERFTSYERNLVFAGETYTAARLSHAELRQGLALDRDELRLDADGLDVGPLRDLVTLRLEVPLLLAVRAVEVTGPGTAANGAVLFSGEVVAGKLRGRRITATATPGGSRLDRKHPRAYLQPGCNHGLFSPGCGLASSAWLHTALMLDPGAAGYPFAFTFSGLARAGGPILTGADAFAGGWLEAGTGATLQRLPIVASAFVAGVLTLTLSRDPAPWIAAGVAVRIYPGCDGTRQTCAGRFGNFANFGGFPFVPALNPTLRTVKVNSGGKK